MLLESKFSLGQIVYLKTDKDQNPRMVIGILIRPIGVLYETGLGSAGCWSYEMEISATKDVVLATTS